MMEFSWYEELSKDDLSLQQGDFIQGCPVILPPKIMRQNHQYDLEVELYNVLIMSQSCDLENGNVEIVLVCPYHTFTDYKNALPSNESNSKKAIKKHFEKLRQGLQPNYHLLDKNDHFDDYLIVDFRNVYGVHIEFLREYVKTLNNRIRVLPPYREHLSQAFARFFMRVGLPHNIPPLS